MYHWYMRKNKVGKKSLLSWMSYHSNSNVTDKRDRIYRVLDLVSSVDRELVGKPNYGVENDFLRAWT